MTLHPGSDVAARFLLGASLSKLNNDSHTHIEGDLVCYCEDPASPCSAWRPERRRAMDECAMSFGGMTGTQRGVAWCAGHARPSAAVRGPGRALVERQKETQMIVPNWQLRRWLAREILDKDIGRRPPQRELRGPVRDSRYRTWIRTLPCAACGTTWDVEAAHTGSDGGMSMKASDYSCIPLCTDCHTMRPDSYHRIHGGRAAFEKQHSIDIGRLVAHLNRIWWTTRQGAA